MRPPEEIYAWLEAAPDRVIAVSTLNDDELLRVSGWLCQHYEENQPTGEILGICLVERSDRWAHEIMTKQNSHTGGDS